MSLSLAILGLAAAGSLDALPSLVGPGEGQGPTLAVPAGDLNGDGLGDLLIGAPADDAAGHEAGAIYVVFDVAGLEPYTRLTEVGVAILGEQPQDRAGFSVAALGDSDGDGLGDVAVGAPEADGDDPVAGRVYVVSGAEVAPGSLGEHPTFRGESRWGRVGARVFGPGDVDGDGLADLLIGAPYPTPSGAPGPGWLGLVLAPEAGWPDERVVGLSVSADGARPRGLDAAWYVREDDTLAGRSAVMLPDQDGDGVRDLLMGAPGLGGHDHDPPPPSDTGHGGEGHTVGAAFLFAGVDDPALMGVTDSSAALVMVEGDGLEALPWQLLLLADGRVVMSAPEVSRVYVMDGLRMGTTAQAAVTLEGVGGSLTGWGVAEGAGALWISEPGWGGGTGRVLGLEALQSGAVEDGAMALEGCSEDGEAGYALAGHPGPDPYGAEASWVGVTAPLASTYAEGDGLVYVLTAEGLDAALAAGCPGTDADPVDADEDGFDSDVDCDDAVAWVYPGALEVCSDGVDDDCDGAVDEACGEVIEDCGCAGGPRGAGWMGVLCVLGLLAGRGRR